VLRVRYSVPGGMLPVPLMLPPVFVPGTPENEAFVRATAAGIRAVGEAIGGILRNLPSSGPIAVQPRPDLEVVPENWTGC
jgi:hypothetical protein